MAGLCAVCINCPQTVFCLPHEYKHDNKHTLDCVRACECVCVCVRAGAEGISEIVETTLMFDKSLEKHTNYIIIMTPANQHAIAMTMATVVASAMATKPTDYNGGAVNVRPVCILRQNYSYVPI